MGQQQLLLIVLGTIIVGVAVIVGINMFTTGAVNAERDALLQDVNAAWHQMPHRTGVSRLRSVEVQEVSSELRT